MREPGRGRLSDLRDRLVSRLPAWPLRKAVLVALGCLVGFGLLVQAPWRPMLGLLGLYALASVAVAANAWNVRGRVPLLGPPYAAYAVGAWAVIGLLLLAGTIPASLARSSLSAAGPTHSQAASPPVPTPTPALVAQLPSPTPSPAPSPTPTRRPTPRPTPTPTPAITLTLAPSPVHRGQRVTLTGQTAPGNDCSISIGYQGAPDLDGMMAGQDGLVSWTWRVSWLTPTGTWPITVSCASATAATKITVS